MKLTFALFALLAIVAVVFADSSEEDDLELDESRYYGGYRSYGPRYVSHGYYGPRYYNHGYRSYGHGHGYGKVYRSYGYRGWH